jgi:hypothetical protein
MFMVNYRLVASVLSVYVGQHLIVAAVKEGGVAVDVVHSDEPVWSCENSDRR